MLVWSSIRSSIIIQLFNKHCSVLANFGLKSEHLKGKVIHVQVGTTIIGYRQTFVIWLFELSVVIMYYK